MPPMSQREYARHRGVSHVAVGKAIKSGRISKALRDGKIDPDLADALWAHNTDQSKQHNGASGGKKATKASPAAPAAPAPDGQSGGGDGSSGSDAGPTAGQSLPGSGPNYAQSRAFRETYLARLARLEFEERSGKLIDADMVRVAAFNAARRAREMILGLADRISPLVAGEPNQFECHRIIKDECVKICEEIKKYGDDPVPASQ